MSKNNSFFFIVLIIVAIIFIALNFKKTGMPVTLNYTITSLQMNDGCAGTISINPDAGHPLTVCVSDDGVMGRACTTYWSGTYGVGSTLSTTTFDYDSTKTYRLLISFARLGYISMSNSALNGHIDSGTSASSSHYSTCMSSDTFHGVRTSTSNCLSAYTEYPDYIMSFNAALLYTSGARANCIDTETPVSVGISDTCRIYEGYSRTGGSDAIIGSCTYRTYYQQENQVCPGTGTVFNQYAGYSGNSCTPGTKDTCPSSLCNSAGGGSYFSNNIATTGSSLSFNDRLIATGTLSGIPITCTITGDTAPACDGIKSTELITLASAWVATHGTDDALRTLLGIAAQDWVAHGGPV